MYFDGRYNTLIMLDERGMGICEHTWHVRGCPGDCYKRAKESIMESPIEKLIREIQEETRGTKILGDLIVDSIRELAQMNETINSRIDGIICRRDTGRMDVDV